MEKLIKILKETLMDNKACDGTDIIMEHLGLEPDYFIDILDVSNI